jgi:hypothetical protein
MRERAALPIAYERSATGIGCQVGENPGEGVTNYES